jgi:GMP synthase (glutamine-hydrolysing)
VPTVLLIGHDDNETFGLAPASLRARGLDVVEHRSSPDKPLPTIDGVDGVIEFGGSMNIDMVGEYPFLLEERRLVRRILDLGIPFLGICLGGQMLARAMDKRVYPVGTRQLGFGPLHMTPEASGDPLMSVFRDGDMVFHWHEDTFELPDGAVVLGIGDPVRLQAFRIGGLAWGTQFHFELDRAELELWLEAAGEDVVRAWGKTSAAVLDEADRHLATQEARANEVFGRFADVVRSTTAALRPAGR